ncbi:hypothetical protein [Paenibacillus sp. ISL-20]|uniref:hypothetical protein n=1 Tax=Paenibacillus sp. ISL-20 TaxID=2819163 RepID=UPI001BEC428F|nr:hypothetical protein [Paenibacillus sp. ISL-20]MBT2760464.1 hypothetical protein [Paenibacillus sp. ISL-20]
MFCTSWREFLHNISEDIFNSIFMVIGERAGKRPLLPERLGEVPAEASRLLAAAEGRSAVRIERQATAVAYRRVNKETGHV